MTMMNRNQMLVVLALIAAFEGHVRAQSGSLTQQSVRGTWEAIIPDDVRVVIMELGPSGSVVAMSVGRSGPITTLFDVRSLVVSKGRLEVKTVGIDTTDQLSITGTGTSLPEDGRLTATIVLKDVKGKELNRWKTIFVDLRGHYIDTVMDLARDAEKHISKLRGRDSGAAANPTR